MNWGSPEFVISIIAISYGAWIINNWVRARHGYELEDEWGGKTAPTDTGETKQLILEGNPGSLSQAEIAKRLKELEKLKIHPREVAENAAVINRLKAAYENQLGDIRTAIENHLVQFEAILAKQNDTDIKLARASVTEFLDEIDRLDVF